MQAVVASGGIRDAGFWRCLRRRVRCHRQMHDEFTPLTEAGTRGSQIPASAGVTRVLRRDRDASQRRRSAHIADRKQRSGAEIQRVERRAGPARARTGSECDERGAAGAGDVKADIGRCVNGERAQHHLLSRIQLAPYGLVQSCMFARELFYTV